MESLPSRNVEGQSAYRLVPSKYPTVSLFDDVADQDEFDSLYAIQALTNPRLRQELGNLNLVPANERPYGIRGCNYAMGPFVHINPAGSRFSRGDFGIFYAAINVQTAIAETRYHQQRYFAGVTGLKYDRLTMRCLKAQFRADLVDITGNDYRGSDWYHPQDYSSAQQLGAELKTAKSAGLVYDSVRNPGNDCYGLFSPKLIIDVIQTAHYEYIWDGREIRIALETQEA